MADTQATQHTLKWWRNGTPRKVSGGTQYVGTTQAKATCACGWTGSLFPTRDIEFYSVVGEREFAAHLASGARS